MKVQQPSNLRLADILAEIQDRTTQPNTRASAPPPLLTALCGTEKRIVRPPNAHSLQEFQSRLDANKILGREVGCLPPNPGTLRGHAGMAAVKLVRRSLFWYSQQLTRFHESVVATLTEIGRALRRLNQALPVVSALAARVEEAERRAAMLSERNEILEREIRMLALRLQILEEAALSGPGR